MSSAIAIVKALSDLWARGLTTETTSDEYLSALCKHFEVSLDTLKANERSVFARLDADFEVDCTLQHVIHAASPFRLRSTLH